MTTLESPLTDAAALSPFRVTGPALLSFSGGRTSGLMLRRILDAHGGTLPADVIVAFANTGKECPETLDFVHEVETRWNVPIVWLEYDPSALGEFRVVTYETASRAGEPFEAMIRHRHDRPNSKPYLPNTAQRICTQYLKLHCFKSYMQAAGYGEMGEWANIVGIRADEPRRVATLRGRNTEKGEDNRMPLTASGITKADVLRFWEAQPFRLNLRDWEGNCDACFLKGIRIRTRIARDTPEKAAWWQRMEDEVGATFDKGASVRQILAMSRLPMLPGILDEDESDTGRVSCLCTD